MKKILGTTARLAVLALMKKFLKLLSVAFIACLAAANAEAQTWTVTVSGTIYSDGNFGNPNYASPFGKGDVSLVGSPYSLTITTNPSLNSVVESSTATFHSTFGGTIISGGPGAPYTITATVNGVTFIQTEPIPAYNRSYLLSVRQPNFMDAVGQDVRSNACSWAYGLCVESFINAYSLNTPFLRSLDFSRSLTVSDGLDPGSNAYFAFRNGPYLPGSINQYSAFYGSISALSIKHHPLSHDTAEPD